MDPDADPGGPKTPDVTIIYDKYSIICSNKLFFCRASTQLYIDLPVLTDFYILEQHFNWVCNGGIRKTVERKMDSELKMMERFLLHQGKEAVNNIITTHANDCNEHIDESGSTYSWVGILRAAENHWGTLPYNTLFRTELEGINGTSPQLIIKTQDRYASFSILLCLIRTSIKFRFFLKIICKFSRLDLILKNVLLLIA